MIKSSGNWLLRQLSENPKVRSYLEQQVAAAHPILTSPHMQFAPPGHFYSPLPDLDEVSIDTHRLYSQSPHEDGLQLNPDAQRQLLSELAKYFPAFDWSQDPVVGKRYWMKNYYFEDGDALILFAMIHHLSPRRIIEVGSGFSSALMLDVNERDCDPKMDLCFIEPYPERLEKLITPADQASVKLIKSPIQKVSLEEFDTLGANDFLFIDSSHVSKIGSDVNYILFQVLPRLQRGVIVHFHDIFFPFEYPLKWINEGRAWNEIYLLRAFLQYNEAFEILLFNSYLANQFRAEVEAVAPLMSNNPFGSLWLRKK